MTVNHVTFSLLDQIIKLRSKAEQISETVWSSVYVTCFIRVILNGVSCQIVSYLLDLPEKDEEEVERAQINNFDTLWGETGGNTSFHITAGKTLLLNAENA